MSRLKAARAEFCSALAAAFVRRSGTIGLGERQRAQEHRVDDGEDGDAGADAESDGQHGGPREERITHQRSEAPSGLTGYRSDPCAEPDVPDLLGHLVDHPPGDPEAVVGLTGTPPIAPPTMAMPAAPSDARCVRSNSIRARW